MESSSNISNQFGQAHSTGDGITVQSGVNYGTININQRSRNTLFPNVAFEATFDASNKEHVSSCLPGTRVKVLSDIQHWIDGDSPKRLYWLNGMAGTGKSTIAITLARMYKRGEGKSIRLAGTFFFSRGAGDLSSAARFAATIAIQLSEVSKDLRNLIDQAIESNIRLDSLSVQEQWHKLVVQPVSQFYQSAHSQLPHLLFIIDALDECSNDGDVNIIIRCLEQLTRIGGGCCRVFLTSRPDQPIKVGMRYNASRSRENFILHDIEKSIIDSDLGLYYRHQLSHINTGKSLGEDLLSQNMIDHLVDRSHGLFIHAATVCRFIQDGNYASVGRLKKLLETERSVTAEQELDKMYTTVLEYSFVSVTSRLTKREAEIVHKLFKQIIGSIAVMFDIMSSEDLAQLLGETLESVHITLSALHSVIDVPDDHQKPIRILHPSFREFLLDPRRCLNSTYSIFPYQAHSHLVTRCFDILMSLLRRNPLQIEDPGASTLEVSIETLNSCIPTSLRYSARYLVDHILKSNFQERLDATLLKFLEAKSIFWLELLAWIGQLRFAIPALLNLESIFTNKPIPGRSEMFETINIRKSKPSNSLLVLIDDSIQFLRVHIVVIEESPLQIYASALPFSPRHSEMRMRNYKERPAWISNETATLEEWPKSSKSISVQLSDGSLSSIAVSPDCMSILTVCDSGKVYIWDRKTGVEKLKLEGSCRSIFASASFSPNGDHVACVTDTLVCVWSIRTPGSFSILPDSDLDLINLKNDADVFPDDLGGIHYGRPVLAFSPDSKYIAVSSGTRDIWILDVTLARPAKFHFQAKHFLQALTFSADGSLLFASVAKGLNGSWPAAVSVWDIRTGVELAHGIHNIPDEGPKAFSLGSTRYIAVLPPSAFDARTVLVIRDARTGSEEWRFPLALPHQNHLNANSWTAIFKADSDEPLVMATMTGMWANRWLFLWTPHDHKRPRMLKAGYSPICHIVLSPDGEFALSASELEVEICNITDFTPMPSTWGFIRQALRIAIKERLNRAFPMVQVSNHSFQRSIQSYRWRYTWLKYLKIHATEMSSNCGSILVTWTADDMAVIWNTSTGKESCRFAIPKLFSGFAVSPNGAILAIRTKKGIQLWETKTGRKAKYLTYRKGDGKETLRFSPTGRKLYLLPRTRKHDDNRHNELNGWDVTKLHEILPLKIPIPHWPRPALALSPDEEIYAVWSLPTGEVEVRTTLNHQLKCGRLIKFVRRIKIRADNKLLWILVEHYPVAAHPSDESDGLLMYQDAEYLLGYSMDEYLSDPVEAYYNDQHNQYESYIWDLDKDQMIPLDGSKSNIEPQTAVFSGDGRLLAILIADEVHLYDTTDFTPQSTLQLGFRHNDIEFSSCGTHIMTNHGMFPLPGVASTISPRLFIEDSWIQEDERRLVALPPTHSYSMLVDDHTVTLYNPLSQSKSDTPFQNDPIFLNFEKGPKGMSTQQEL